MNTSITSVKDKTESVAIGGFDGLHIAHQHLLSHLEGEGALLVIEKHFPYALTPGTKRCQYTFYPCFFLDFHKIKDMKADTFTAYLLEYFPSLKKIVVGYDFRFGKNRVGDASLLQKLPNIEVVVIEEQKLDGVSIHTKEIKKRLEEGDILFANRLLGRPYSIEGQVISGQGLGKKALYPTFNLDTDRFFLPKEGVYISSVKIDNIVYPALTFIGKRFSTDGKFSVETHILYERDFDGIDALEVSFLTYLRENRKFDRLAVLKKQISEDIILAKNYFEKAI